MKRNPWFSNFIEHRIHPRILFQLQIPGLIEILVQMFGVGPLICIVVKHTTLWEIPFENLCLENHLTASDLTVGSGLRGDEHCPFQGFFLCKLPCFGSSLIYDEQVRTVDVEVRESSSGRLGKVYRHLGQGTFFPP